MGINVFHGIQFHGAESTHPMVYHKRDCLIIADLSKNNWTVIKFELDCQSSTF